MSNMRAVVRLIALLVLAGGSFTLAPSALLILGVLLLLWAALRNSGLPAVWGQRVLRLKWFFLAIFVLYLFGGLQLQGTPDWVEAGYRVGVLVLLVGIVAVSLDGIPADELAQGLSRVLSPLKPLGVPVDRFSRRLAATLDAVGHMQDKVRELDRSGGFAAVAALCSDAEHYQPSVRDERAFEAVALVDYFYLAFSVLLVIGLQVL